MEVVTTDQHLVLAFTSACARSGYAPTVDEVTAWLENPHPRAARYTSVFTALSANLLQSFGNLTGARLEAPAENIVAHLARIGWVTVGDTRVRPTTLGEAMYAAAERSDLVQSAPTVVVLGREDPLAYPTLFSELMKASSGLLVDPYIRVDQLHQIVAHTELSRVLLKKTSEPDLAAIEVYLTATTLPRRINVRLTDDKRVHDRIIVWGDGKTVQTMGASMNTVEKGTGTVITQLPASAADAMRGEAEAWWSNATVLPRPVSPVTATPPATRPKAAASTPRRSAPEPNRKKR